MNVILILLCFLAFVGFVLFMLALPIVLICTVFPSLADKVDRGLAELFPRREKRGCGQHNDE